jgi:predicted DNA-binding transcriptional regulator AlpA
MPNSSNNSPPQVWLGAAAVEARYGKGRSTIDRWLRDRSLNFPRPRYIRTKRVWHVDELDAFDLRLLEQLS